MKKFFNILFALSTLGFVFACKPASNTDGKTGQHAQKNVDPVYPVNPVNPDDPNQPVKPQWDGTPEEILAEEGCFWMGHDSIYHNFLGFKYDKSTNELYAYVVFGRNKSYNLKDAENFWPAAQAAFDKDAMDHKTGRRYWYKVQWEDDKSKFTIPELDIREFVGGDTYELDKKTKSLRRYYNSRKGDLKKWNVYTAKTAYTPQVQALTEPGKMWYKESTGNHYIFAYDKDNSKLYYWVVPHDSIHALEKKDFESDSMYLMFQDPENASVFNGLVGLSPFKVTIAKDLQTIEVFSYCYQTEAGYKYVREPETAVATLVE